MKNICIKHCPVNEIAIQKPFSREGQFWVCTVVGAVGKLNVELELPPRRDLGPNCRSWPAGPLVCLMCVAEAYAVLL